MGVRVSNPYFRIQPGSSGPASHFRSVEIDVAAAVILHQPYKRRIEIKPVNFPGPGLAAFGRAEIPVVWYEKKEQWLLRSKNNPASTSVLSGSVEATSGILRVAGNTPVSCNFELHFHSSMQAGIPEKKISPSEAVPAPAAGSTAGYLRAALRIAFAFTGLFVFSLLLLHESAFHKTGGSTKAAVRIDSVVEVKGRNHSAEFIPMKVFGTAPPGTFVDLGTGDERIEGRVADKKGEFEEELDVPAHARSLWAEITGATWEKVRTVVPIKQSLRPLNIAFAYYLPDLKLIWIAGETSSFRMFVVKRRQSGQGFDEFFSSALSDANGFWDCFIPSDSAPDSLWITAPDSLGANSPVLVRVRRCVSDSLPVSRAITLNLSDPAKLDTLFAAARKASERESSAYYNMDEALESRLEFNATLPLDYPSVKALAAGQISAGDFFNAVFGRFNGGLQTFFPEDFEWQGGQADEEEASRSLRYYPRVSFFMNENSRLATIKGELTLVVPNTLDFSRSFSLAQIPLLSSKDTLKVLFNGRKFRRTSVPYPRKLTDQMALWIGPARLPNQGFVTDFGLGFAGMGSREELEEKLDKIEMKDVSSRRLERGESGIDKINHLQDKYRWTIWGRIWMSLLFLIPLLWGFGLASRKSRGDPAYGPLAGLAAFFCVWSCRGLLLILAGFVAQGFYSALSLLHRFNDLLRISHQQGTLQLWPKCFWILLLVVVGLAPLYFPVSPGWRKEARTIRGLGSHVIRGIGMVISLGICLCAAMIFSGSQGEGSPRFAMATAWLPSFFPDLIMGALPLLALALLPLGLAFLSRGGFLFGLGQLLLISHLINPDKLKMGAIAAWAGKPFHVLGAMPDKAVLLLVGLLSLPLFRRLLQALLPLPDRYRQSMFAAVAIVGALLVFPFLSAGQAMGAGSLCIFVGLFWVLFHGLTFPNVLANLRAWMGRRPVLSLIGCSALGALALGWPLTDQGGSLFFEQIGDLVAKIDRMLPFVLGMGFLLVLYSQTEASDKILPEAEALPIGFFLFVSLIVGVETQWLWLPLPFLVAMAWAKYRLFRTPGDMLELGGMDSSAFKEAKAHISAELKAAFARSRLGAVRDVLDQQLTKAAITPEEYEKKKESYVSHFLKQGGISGEAEAMERKRILPLIFSSGGPDLKENFRSFFVTGALLAIIPVLVGLYRDLSPQGPDFPYPIADFLISLARSLCKWLLMAGFFGLFYGALRGKTGLSKGARLSLLIIIPCFVHRLLGGQSLELLKPQLIWAAEVFLFLSFLGLWAGDWRLLRINGFRAKDLLLIHNLPLLSVYASTVLAALISSGVALLTGGLQSFLASLFKGFGHK